MTPRKPRQPKPPPDDLESYLAAKAKRKAEYDARGEDTPEKIEWLIKGIALRRAELGWTLSE